MPARNKCSQDNNRRKSGLLDPFWRLRWEQYIVWSCFFSPGIGNARELRLFPEFWNRSCPSISHGCLYPCDHLLHHYAELTLVRNLTIDPLRYARRGSSLSV